MSKRSRPSPSRRTKATIALALLGVLAGVVAYRSQLKAPAQRAAPPATDAPVRAAVRPRPPRASSAPPAAHTTLGPRAANGANPSVRPKVLQPAPAGSRADDPGVAVEVRGSPERSGLFRISGTPGGRLAPGVAAPLDLVLTNPHTYPISVMSLTVRVRSVRAPRANAGRPCTTRDFAVAPFSGRRFKLRPAASARLGELGFSPARWPRVSMLDRPVNQDGCKGAALTLDYRGAGGR